MIVSKISNDKYELKLESPLDHKFGIVEGVDRKLIFIILLRINF
jgi:phage-related protein